MYCRIAGLEQTVHRTLEEVATIKKEKGKYEERCFRLQLELDDRQEVRRRLCPFFTRKHERAFSMLSFTVEAFPAKISWKAETP